MDAFQDFGNDKICGLVDLWIRGRNGQRNREIIKLRLIDGLTFEALAEKMEMSVSQIKRIVYRGTEEITKNRK